MVYSPVVVSDDLELLVDGRVVTCLQADAALNLAANLARTAFRRIATEELAGFLFADEPDAGQPSQAGRIHHTGVE